ncbi:vitamin K epoxide reductase family protein [Desulfosediminicola flagellatus]|uniref:vitamin K epoxide reductase family protein n=1 Tax=Desulfosediminicola flagellatus TaxID=2569541 RepID=UPI0010AB5B47|nr:vitamin K epoxide reductase family protein [Desulfosediminicola flagellatus]
MLYQSKTSLEPIPPAINLLLLLSLGGALITAVQALLVVIKGDILCLNEGCKVVESLTTVPPLAFNLAGFIYFFVIFRLLHLGKNKDRGWLKWARLFLLCGMAVEGVLVCFQYYVAEVFCSYCLIILSIVVLLNIMLGIRQIVAALALFSAVVVAFSSLEFSPRSESGEVVLEEGIYGHLEKDTSAPELYLFFSSTCPHCEEVIETIGPDFTCSLNFNPVDTLKESPIADLIRQDGYSPLANRRFLKNLGINEIPVLTIKEPGEIRTLKGKQKIIEYLDNTCRSEGGGPDQTSDFSGESSQVPGFQFQIPGVQDEGCKVDVDCEEPLPENNQQ